MKKTSRFSPINPLWSEDLAPRMSPVDFDEKLDSPLLDQDINHIDDSYLEISRTSSVLRGGGLFIGIVFFLLISVGFVPFIVMMGEQFFTVVPWGAAVIIAMLIGLSVMALRFIIFDCCLPRDTPVRFNRIEQKIYAYEYIQSFSSFKPWRGKVKVYDWDCVEAEIAKLSGFTGKAYVARYELHLVICRPGTNEAVDRIALKKNDVTGLTFYEIWSYIRRYMADGTRSLPAIRERDQDVGFLKSLFSYMPYASPTEEGRRFRKKMRWIDYCLALLLVWFFWLWIPLGICHYIAMRCAPDPQWPPEIDRESRSLLKSPQPGQ